jgi:catechol 2,3-dioxygenase-like lactoylglutathione lyase family enzyme
MTIKVSDLAYCRMQAPDLDVSAEFLVQFGLIPAGREADRLFFRCADPSAFCYVVQRGPARFLGFAFNAKSQEDLDRLATDHDLPVVAIDGPGGGVRVRLREPNGYDVDVVFGMDAAPAIDVPRQAINTAAQPFARKGELYRVKQGPTPLKRLAHVVLATPRVRETAQWFRANLGMIASDEVVAGPERELIGAFMRIDEGEDYVDHHALFFARSAEAGLNHISFESQDIDAVLSDHFRLKSLDRYEHRWGIGRHTLGSQLFDYWADPNGYTHEHWADSDRLNASTPTNIVDAREAMVTQWGDPSSDKVRNGTRV